jgi:hypothetical protein
VAEELPPKAKKQMYNKGWLFLVMKKIKILSAIAALCVTGAIFTACSSNTSDEVTAETDVTTEAEAADDDTSETEAADDSFGGNAADEDTVIVGDDDFGADADADPDEAEDTDGGSEDEEEYSMIQFSEENVNPLRSLVEATVAGGEWPYLSEITDELIISDYLTLDKENENYEEAIYMQCPMSANLTEVIIIKAADPDAAAADLEARQKKAQEQDAERAGSSIVGTHGDYAYFLMCSDAKGAEELLTAAIDAL